MSLLLGRYLSSPTSPLSGKRRRRPPHNPLEPFETCSNDIQLPYNLHSLQIIVNYYSQINIFHHLELSAGAIDLRYRSRRDLIHEMAKDLTVLQHIFESLTGGKLFAKDRFDPLLRFLLLFGIAFRRNLCAKRCVIFLNHKIITIKFMIFIKKVLFGRKKTRKTLNHCDKRERIGKYFTPHDRNMYMCIPQRALDVLEPSLRYF